MYLFLISFGLASLVTGIMFALGMVGYDDPLYATLGVGAFVAVFLVSFALLGRQFTKGLEATMKQVEQHLSQRRFDPAMNLLKDARKKYKNWHPFIGRQITAQLGQLLYIQGKFNEALPFLEKSLRWDWTARAMLACAYHKSKNAEKMAKVLEDTSSVRAAKKEPLFWTVYAYLLRKNGKKKDAEKVLERGIKHNPDEKRLQNSLQALRGNKRMKVKVYGPAWQQFRL